MRVVSVLLLLRSLWLSGVVRGEFSNKVHFNVAFSITLAFALLNAVWLNKMVNKVLRVASGRERKLVKSKAA